MLISCSTPWAGYQSIISKYNNTYTEWQFDSICESENIPNNLDKWLHTPLQDYETKYRIYRYSYILDDSLMFIVTKDSFYTVNKRILIK